MADRTGHGIPVTVGKFHIPLAVRLYLQILIVVLTSHLAIAGKNGHVATFDWKLGTLHMELQLKETCRDITYAFSCITVYG